MQYIQEIKQLVHSARSRTYQAINAVMVEVYWEIGRRIIEEEQSGQIRAEYGKEVLKKLSVELTAEFGKGFSERSLREFRQFYQYFPNLDNWRTVFAKLNWSHFQRVLRVSDEKARTYYLQEAAQNMWSVRVLDRNISTLYFERLISTQKGSINSTDANSLRGEDFIKNPTVLEFLNLPIEYSYTEALLEKALIDNLQKFILELGKGFAFVERQQHIKTETSDFYIDLVFYNFLLKCFVIIELKTDKITHQDIGQLDMYVRMYDDLKKGDRKST